MTSCEPVNEQTSFNNPEPMTGFEHTVTFDFQGTKMVIPYGYLARYTQDNATKWLSDTPGQDAYSINLIEISVYYKKTDQGWVLEPYNQQNKAHFIQFLRDGLDSVDDIVIRKDACHLNQDLGKSLLDLGFKKSRLSILNMKLMKIKGRFLKTHIFMNYSILRKEKIRRLLLIRTIIGMERTITVLI